jgi:competence protein ComEA
MKRFFALLPATIAALGLAAAVPAFAQKDTKPADTKKMEAPKADAKKAEPAKETKMDTKKAEPMDINTASEKELATLKGIGDARAAAIVKGRPYKGKDELVQKKIIPESVYKDIKDEIIAKQAPAAEKKADTKPADKKADAKPAAKTDDKTKK